MGELILTFPRTDGGSIALGHLRERGRETFGSVYRASLEQQLSRLRAGEYLRSLPSEFHLFAVEDGQEPAFVNRVLRWHDGEANRNGRGTIEAVELNWRVYLSASLGLPVHIGTATSSHQHYLQQMQVDDAHRDGWTGKGVRVVVVDTGLDPAANITAAASFDLTLTPPGPGPAQDNDGHGTAMATLVRAVAPDAAICVVKALHQHSLTLWSLAGALATAQADCDPDIVSLSLGMSNVQPCGLCGGSAALRSYIVQKLISSPTAQGKEPVYVVSTGNDSSPIAVRFPASLDDCVAVGSVDSGSRRSRFSNHGPQHPRYALAPGGETDATGAVTEFVGTAGQGPQAAAIHGTSPAAAYASGFVALLRSDPALSALTRDAFLDQVWRRHVVLPAHAAGKPLEYGRGVFQYQRLPPAGAEVDLSMALAHDLPIGPPLRYKTVAHDDAAVYIGGVRVPKKKKT